MNTRQRQIMHLLSEKKDKEFITINEIAKMLNCSDKTVRNDFKQIDDWLKKEFQATIIRKPNIGVRIDISKDEKKRLLSLMEDGKRNNHGNDINRKIKILSWLIKDDKTLSLLDLSERFFVSKHVIKQDLKEIESWLELFDLSIESRKKVGIRLIGDEKHKRAALSRIHHLGKDEKLKDLYETWFANYEITNVKQQIKKIEKELNKEFTKESINNLILHLLITVKRIKEKQIISMTKHDWKS
ncbi:transcriptional antiterminator [Peribacillus deserti]|uniref:Transcriptional antiterminator n=1 Tax=Peribacillus deserti TaxID=673318 RepID=A0ABS2QJM1_9BACI|nr:HTH domain-containing protein [Peribacillus deserti]MBM7692486.1 transcriptional antiterminator [Peribacillus deserti]